LIIAPTDVVIERVARRRSERRRRQRRLWLLGASLWIMVVVGFVTLRAWQAQPKPSLPKRGNRPTVFPVMVMGAALQQVKNVKAVWVRHEEQGGQPCDLYEVRGQIVNPKDTADTLALEVTMQSGKTNLHSDTIVEELAAGEKKSFTLPIRDFTSARDRRRDIRFLFSVSQED
jgi:hypothetical protein